MFRKFRKIYFKIYHLLKLLGIFILIIGFIPIVKADELPSCYDDLLVPYTIGNYTNPPLWNETNQNWQSGCNTGQNNSKPLQVLVPIYENKSTYIKFPKAATGNDISIWAFVGYNENKTEAECRTSSVTTWITWEYNKDTKILKITPTENNTYKYVSLGFSKMITWNNFTRPVPWGDQETGNLAISDEDISECPVKPEPEQPTSNEVYNNFMEIYIEKIEYLAKGFMENPYLVAMVGIIIGWIVLELFLRILHLRGGYKK